MEVGAHRVSSTGPERTDLAPFTGRVQHARVGRPLPQPREIDPTCTPRLWEASDRICGKRLKAVLPALVEAMERHGHLELDGEVRGRVLAASAATIDRLLGPVRREARTRRKRRRKRKRNARLPIHTFSDWGEPLPGFLEVDVVAHCGGRLTGSYIHTLVGTDVCCSGWTEAVPLLVREQSGSFRASRRWRGSCRWRCAASIPTTTRRSSTRR